MILFYMALRRGPASAGQPPPAPSAWSRADACGQILRGAGKSLPRSLWLLQLERNLVLVHWLRSNNYWRAGCCFTKRLACGEIYTGAALAPASVPPPFPINSRRPSNIPCSLSIPGLGLESPDRSNCHAPRLVRRSFFPV